MICPITNLEKGDERVINVTVDVKESSLAKAKVGLFKNSFAYFKVNGCPLRGAGHQFASIGVNSSF